MKTKLTQGIISLVAIMILAAMPLWADVTVTIGDINCAPDSSIIVPVMANDVVYSEEHGGGLAGAKVNIAYDTLVVEVTDVTAGDLTSWFAWEYVTPDTVKILAIEFGTSGHIGDVVIANITFHAIGSPGSSSILDLCDSAGQPLKLTYPDGIEIPSTPIDGSFAVQGGLESPENVIISIAADLIHIEWDEVLGANSYKVNSSSNPYSEFTEDTSGTFDGTSWTAPVSNEKKFYFITAED